MRNVPQRLRYLDIWFLFGESTWRGSGGTAYLEKMHHLGWTLGYIASLYFQFAVSAWCLWLRLDLSQFSVLGDIPAVCCHAVPPPPMNSFFLESQRKIKTLFLKWPWSWHSITATEKYLICMFYQKKKSEVQFWLFYWVLPLHCTVALICIPLTPNGFGKHRFQFK